MREALKFYDNYGAVYEERGILKPRVKNHVCVKEAVFPFNKLSGADLILGPEMKSTGEVMGISEGFAKSFAKAYFPLIGNQIACQQTVAENDLRTV